jgi:diguanylate cyclase (GGDEF)-like protein
VKLIEEIKDRLSMFKNLYDNIRIVDPVNKRAFIINELQELQLEGVCYGFWKKDSFCENCISIRAYLENDTFVKIEHKENGQVILLTATPIVTEEGTYILEILKDISKNGQIINYSNYNINSAEILISEMNDKIIKDELTGIYNRRYINERLKIDINDCFKKRQALSVIMADIDSFKNINDNYGHLAGDKIIKDFAKILESSIRKSTDWVSRYGGEEFLIVLNNTDSKEAYEAAENIRKLIERTKFIYGSHIINITSSFGISCIKDDKFDIEVLIENADKNLYEAKSLGRNKTVVNV